MKERRINTKKKKRKEKTAKNQGRSETIRKAWLSNSRARHHLLRNPATKKPKNQLFQIRLILIPTMNSPTASTWSPNLSMAKEGVSSVFDKNDRRGSEIRKVEHILSVWPLREFWKPSATDDDATTTTTTTANDISVDRSIDCDEKWWMMKWKRNSCASCWIQQQFDAKALPPISGGAALAYMLTLKWLDIDEWKHESDRGLRMLVGVVRKLPAQRWIRRLSNEKGAGVSTWGPSTQHWKTSRAWDTELKRILRPKEHNISSASTSLVPWPLDAPTILFGSTTLFFFICWSHHRRRGRLSEFGQDNLTKTILTKTILTKTLWPRQFDNDSMHNAKWS